MREKDHSPRKMLPSPKQGAIYPNGLPFPPLQLPFDLITAINRSSSSSASSSNDSSPSPVSHHHHQHHSSKSNNNRRHEQSDQPLDLRVDHKKSSIAYNEHEHENENENHLEDENSNSIIANNNYVKSDSNHEKSPSPVDDHDDDEVDLNSCGSSRNAKRMLNNHHLHHHHQQQQQQHQLNMNGLSAATPPRLSNASLFPPPSLHPLMLEAITKAARLGIPYNAAFPLLPPPPSQVAFRLNKEQDLLNVPQLLNHHNNNSHCEFC